MEWRRAVWSPCFPSIQYETSQSLMQIRWWKQRVKTRENMKGKADWKEEWEGRRPPKAPQKWRPFQYTTVVSVNQAVRINNVRPVQGGLMSSLIHPTPSAILTLHFSQTPCDRMNLTSDSSASCNLPICTHVKKPDQSKIWPQSGNSLKEVQEICNTGEDNGDDGRNSRMK